MSPAALRAAYLTKGYALIPALLPREEATRLLATMKDDFASEGDPLDDQLRHPSVLVRPAIEVYGYRYPPLNALHWSLTRTIADQVGAHLLPTYCYFRIYREGDICRVHCDRNACEHSVSLTLAYSDERPWAFEIATARAELPCGRADEDFGPDDKAEATMMQPGDGVLYQGIHHYHARTTPNPNAWSAHLFLHWVSRDGPYADQAFDGKIPLDGWR